MPVNRDQNIFIDLQEPLGKIRLFGDPLRRQLGGQLPVEAEDALARMLNASERSQSMVNGLLELSRVKTHGRNFDPVELARVTEDEVSDLEAHIQAVNGQVEIDELPGIEGDALALPKPDLQR